MAFKVDDQKKTKYFQNCLGVFQGGGCKVIAFAGAYEEAYKRGVFFSEVIGTSGGSIVAVLIAAGATPEKINEILKKLDFNSFLKRRHKNIAIQKPLWTFLLPLFIKKTKLTARVIKYLGIYDSKYIREFIDKELRVLLNKDRAIKFSDLPMPVTVISGDIEAGKLKAWKFNETQDDEVGLAVQASCSIPIFFQPVGNRYVDGGILANLPVFAAKARSVFDKIIGFSFYESNVGSINSYQDYFNRLFHTIVSGATDLQLSQVKNAHIIKIDSCGFSATDFDKINSSSIDTLIKSGQRATREFLEAEGTNLVDHYDFARVSLDTFQSFNFILRSIEAPKDEILIADSETNWAFSLFPVFIKSRGSKIKIMLTDAQGDEQEQYRRRLLELMGCEIQITPVLPFRGFIFDGDTSSSYAILFGRSQLPSNKFHSKLYHGEEDHDVIGLLRKEFYAVPKNWNGSVVKFEVKKVNLSDFETDLKRVEQYKGVEIVFQLMEIDIRDMIFITKYVKGYKYRQAEILADLYREKKLDLYEPAILELKNSKPSKITPPVVEKHGNKYFVIEGNARALYCARKHYWKIKVIVANNVMSPMPSTDKFSINQLLIADEETTGDKRYGGYKHGNYRKIELQMHNPKTSLL